MRASVSVVIALFILQAPGNAGEPGKKAREVLAKPGPVAELRGNLNTYMNSKEVKGDQLKFNQRSAQYRSPAKGVLFSAVVPGAGQFYNGSTLKGVAFLVVEAVAIIGHFHFQGRGSDFEDKFEALADGEWNENAYWDWMSQVSGVPRQNLTGLREFESANFSHFLPEQKGQQYYENIGKYNQFVFGWNDFRNQVGAAENFAFNQYQSGFYEGVKLEEISPTRTNYMQIRTDSNNNLKRATALVTAAFLNHVISAFDAGLSAKRHNQKLAASLNLNGFLYDNEFVPALALDLAW